MRSIAAPNEYYHLYSRGVDKRLLFLDDSDYARFLFLILYFQSPIQIHNTSWYTQGFLKTGSFNLGKEKMDQIIQERLLSLTAFVLMPNHFHLLVHNIEEMAVSVYMQRVLTAYAKYFNLKYKKTGHVFESTFKSVHVSNNTQLLHLSAYIHKNPVKNYEKYPWSSYSDFTKTNRWGELLDTGPILGQFKTPDLYKQFVSSSTAKEPLA